MQTWKACEVWRLRKAMLMNEQRRGRGPSGPRRALNDMEKISRRFTRIISSRHFENVTGKASSPRNTNPRRQRNRDAGTARRKLLVRRSSVLRAIWPSRRASGAPTQSWTPNPKATCWLSVRARSRVLASVNWRSSRLAEVRTAKTNSPRGIATPATVRSSLAKRSVAFRAARQTAAVPPQRISLEPGLAGVFRIRVDAQGAPEWHCRSD